MTINPEYLEHLTEMPEPLGPVRAKRMFGGAGIFLDGVMFGLVVDDGLYLKADDGNRGDFENLGLGPSTYQKKNREEPVQLSNFEAPAESLDDADELCDWARKAWEAARRAAKK
jgi:DNA transformation protein